MSSSNMFSQTYLCVCVCIYNSLYMYNLYSCFFYNGISDSYIAFSTFVIDVDAYVLSSVISKPSSAVQHERNNIMSIVQYLYVEYFFCFLERKCLRMSRRRALY